MNTVIFPSLTQNSLQAPYAASCSKHQTLEFAYKTMVLFVPLDLKNFKIITFDSFIKAKLIPALQLKSL